MSIHVKTFGFEEKLRLDPNRPDSHNCQICVSSYGYYPYMTRPKKVAELQIFSVPYSGCAMAFLSFLV